MTVKPTDIITLIEKFRSSDWEELHVEVDGLQLFLSRDPKARLHGRAQGAGINAPPMAAATAASSNAMSASPTSVRATVPAHWVAVTAPNLGTFYLAPKPGAAAFVSVGQAVTAESEVCLLEVMKLFTTVKAGKAGVLREVCVEDGTMVEFGDVLFYIEPA